MSCSFDWSTGVCSLTERRNGGRMERMLCQRCEEILTKTKQMCVPLTFWAFTSLILSFEIAVAIRDEALWKHLGPSICGYCDAAIRGKQGQAWNKIPYMAKEGGRRRGRRDVVVHHKYWNLLDHPTVCIWFWNSKSLHWIRFIYGRRADRDKLLLSMYFNGRCLQTVLPFPQMYVQRSRYTS